MTRGKLKRFFATLLVSSALVLSSLSVCAEETESEAAATESVSEEIAEEETGLETESTVMTQDDSFKQTAVSLTEQIVSMTDEQMEQLLEVNDAFTTSAITSWQSIKKEVGELQGFGDQTVEYEDNVVVITSQAQFANRTVTVTLKGDMQQGAYTSMSFDVNYTLGQKMQTAAVNTIIGLCIVFLMLLFLSFLIAQFKHVSKLEAKLTKKEEAPAPAKPAPAPAPVVEEEEELSDDEELVAVIAAAIAAYEGSASADGYVVRSIRKSKKNKWQRA